MFYSSKVNSASTLSRICSAMAYNRKQAYACACVLSPGPAILGPGCHWSMPQGPGQSAHGSGPNARQHHAYKSITHACSLSTRTYTPKTSCTLTNHTLSHSATHDWTNSILSRSASDPSNSSIVSFDCLSVHLYVGYTY